MKKILNILLLTITTLGFLVSPVQANEITYYYGDGTSGTTPPTPAQAAVGGFAVVNPETGVVHGVITGSIEYFGGNNRTIGAEYMGCSAGCLIVQQSTATQNGNVVGFSTNENIEVRYDENRNVFKVAESNTTQSQTVIESSSNTSVIETEFSVLRSGRYYEFGVQDFRNSNGQFQMNEIAPPQNTSAQISATTKEFVCEESSVICSQRLSNNSTTLNEEVTSFSERKTSEQVQAQVVAEAKVKIREHISLILSMLERWIID